MKIFRFFFSFYKIQRNYSTVSGQYEDDRGDYIANEVATDYNAGFQSLVVAVKCKFMNCENTITKPQELKYDINK